MKKWIFSISILAIIGIILYLSKKGANSPYEIGINLDTANQNSSISSSVPSSSGTAPDSNSGLSNSSPQLNNSAAAGNKSTQTSGFPNSSPPPPLNPAVFPPDLNEQKKTLDKAELEKMKAINRAYVVRMEKMMKTNEINSLKKSIEEDQVILKKIEASGTDIEEYKYVEKNLQVRKARLKELLQ